MQLMICRHTLNYQMRCLKIVVVSANKRAHMHRLCNSLRYDFSCSMSRSLCISNWRCIVQWPQQHRLFFFVCECECAICVSGWEGEREMPFPRHLSFSQYVRLIERERDREREKGVGESVRVSMEKKSRWKKLPRRHSQRWRRCAENREKKRNERKKNPLPFYA